MTHICTKALAILIFTMATTVSAQTTDTTKPPAKEPPAVETPKPATPAPKSKSNETAKIKPAQPITDLDAFFKDAEKQLENGPTCQKPPKPMV